jgi:hypothetical protein
MNEEHVLSRSINKVGQQIGQVHSASVMKMVGGMQLAAMLQKLLKKIPHVIIGKPPKKQQVIHGKQQHIA